MQPQDSSPAPRAGKGLPTVLPPSGMHIVKMFVVPLLIVSGLAGIAFLFAAWGGNSIILRPPQDFLADLRNGNEDVRKRAASDLAQVLLRDDVLASDPAFGLDLVGELPPAIAQADRDRAAPGAKVESTSLLASDNYLF